MIDASKAKFPVTLAEFTRLQRAESKRDFTPDELELFREIVDTANEVYQAAAEGDSDTASEILGAINQAAEETPGSGQVAALCRGWAVKGLIEGMKVFKAKIAGLS